MQIDVSFPGGLRVDALLRDFTIHTDQPAASGGEDSAPTPFELFLASLASCAGIYMLTFLKKRGLSAEQAGVSLLADRNGETGMVERVELRLRVPPGFPEKYKPALLRSVDLCTVKKHLLDPPRIAIAVEEEAGSGS